MVHNDVVFRSTVNVNDFFLLFLLISDRRLFYSRRHTNTQYDVKFPFNLMFQFSASLLSVNLKEFSRHDNK